MVFVFITITSASSAQSIFENAITGTDPSNSNPYSTGQTIVNGITSTGIGYGTGLNNSNASDRYNTNGFSTNGTLNAANNDFISWTITPSNCFEVDLTSFVIAYQRSGQGPQNLALRSSVDGFATNIWSVTGIAVPEQTANISLSAVFYQNLTTAITFRLYGWNSGSTNGTFSVNSFTFNGTVNSTNTAGAGTITGINSVCSGSNTTLTVAGYTGNIQWQTSTDNITFTNITGATTETYSTPNINATSYYRAGLTVGTCPTLYSSSYAVNITLPSMTAVDGSACGSSTVDLEVNQVCQPAGATTNWYASSTGGTSLATGNTYTTPILNSTTTYYASNNYSAGAALSTGNRSTTNQRGLRFNALASFVLNSVQINTNNAGSITLELRDNLNQPVAGIAAVVYTATAGTNTVPLGWTIPAGTGYRIIKTAGTPQLSRTDPFTFPIGTAGVLSITSSEDNGAIDNTRYFYFYNWNVSTPRIPVVATIVTPTVPSFSQVSAICPGETLNALPTTSNNGITGTWSPALNNTATTTYTFTPTAGQCTSTATMTITVNPNTNNTTTVSACDSYTWSVNGTTYTTSGTYTSVTGCHTETLVLTITPSTNNTTTASACDSYTWSVNGTTYTTSGTYTSVAGCHTETLVLTITPSTNNSTTASACDSYTWSVTGTTYTASGTYTSVDGCHTETLVLTITPSTNNTTTATACDSYTWSVTGTTYTTSGTYTSVAGCHTETLVLTVNTSNVYFVDADGDGFGSTVTANFCAMPSTGFALNNTDCNDAVATTYPGALELCNSVDDNCSGFIDEGCPSTIAGEEPFNSFSAPSSMYSYCSSFYGTLAGAMPSVNALSSCITGEDVWYNFVAQSSGVTIFIGSYVNDLVIELQDASGNLIDVENTVNGPGTEVLTITGLIQGNEYRFAIRNNNSNLNPGGQYSACVRHLKRGGADSGTSATWPSTLSTCSLFKASYCGGTGVQYRYTWTGLTGTAAGQVFTKTQTSDYLNVTAVTPSLHAGCMYNVLVTAIYSIPNGAGINEVVEMPAIAPTTITISPAASVALRSTDQIANGPRYRGSIVASLPWVCGVTNWRWRFTEVNPLTLQPVGLPIEQNRGAASNYLNLSTVLALQYGKTYAVQSAPLFTYTGSNYQWGPVKYMAIIGSAGMILDASQDASAPQDATASQDSPKNDLQDLAQDFELSVYPNPSRGDALTLSLSGINSENVQVKVYDALGGKIESKRFIVEGTLQTTLNFTSELSNGLYILEVNTEDVTRSVRFMVEK